MTTRKKTLAEVLEGIEEFRQENSVEHKLIDILIIAILATICGADTYKRIEMYAQSKIAWLSTFLELSKGIPSAYTIRRVLMNIDPKQFHAAFIEWVQIISEKISGLVAIDGKTARRTKGLKDGKKALHVVGNCQEKRTPKQPVKSDKTAPSARIGRQAGMAVCAPCPSGANAAGSACHTAPRRRRQFGS